MFKFHHKRADLHFSWDGWMQIMVNPGPNAPFDAFPDRFDIREPDLRDPSRHPKYPAAGSVHFVPETQEAFEALCDTWWRGGEICVGLRDYAADPWQMRSYGITQGAFRYRYAGGSHIEAAAGEVDVWRPLIAIAADDRTPATLSTRWLMGRADGWEEAWLAEHGIVDQGRGLRDAIVDWTIANLPDPGFKGSLAGTFGSSFYQRAVDEFTGDAWEGRRDLGDRVRRIAPWQPWSATREGADGTRWNFWWCGHPCAYVWSPDQKLSHADSIFAEHPDESAQGPVTQWLEQLADSWLRLNDA
ncbi:hypothetical protein C8D87_11474 [Lentzea atacamensis]|uniref:Uncharacterized protein n=1 Tax=Lentzea atacamensis TaxID=531938 RepID=A0ABX9DZ20_9PSEU|nr:hypothetical protein [Lentzea atacamensis]RAS59462.1 hypothetical protein C8D87_11474 [Lentzea atacamensis]